MADEDFEEEEVWSFGSERKEYKRAKDHSSSSSSSSSKRLPSASRLIPKANVNAESHRQSAPVNIPERFKTHRYSNANVADQDNANEEEEEDDDDDQVPPHEWLAKKLARSQISSFSVCEGAGRTLKGRDQRNVRNAVLTRTGFLE